MTANGERENGTVSLRAPAEGSRQSGSAPRSASALRRGRAAGGTGGDRTVLAPLAVSARGGASEFYISRKRVGITTF